MSYRQSKIYKLTTYLKNLPQQSVSSKRNLQVVDFWMKQTVMVDQTVMFEVRC